MSISYSDSRIAKVGRWQDTGSGIWSGWSGSQLKFKVSGTTSITINASVSCSSGKLCLCECVIDNAPQDSLFQYFANNENFSSSRSVSFSLPDAGEHDIIIKTNGYNSDIFNGLSRTTVTSIDVGAGTISSAPLGPKMLQCVGDSWMAADADWPRLLDPLLWNHYQIATGGLQASHMNSQYEYAANGIPASDPAADAAIVCFGVNDYHASVSSSTFQSNLSSLVSKIKGKQSCPIFLIQAPRNGGYTYDQYGTAMQAVSLSYSDVYYIETSSIWGLLTWNSDGKHLDASGKGVFASFINDRLKSLLGITKDFIRVNGIPLPCDSVITSKHWLRIDNLGVLNFPAWLKIRGV